MEKADAHLVVSKLAQYEEIFVGMMVTDELGLALPEDDDATLLTDAFVMFLSYACIGALPLLVYFLGPHLPESSVFSLSISIATLLTFMLGAVKSFFSSVSWIYSGLEATRVGLACAFLAFAAGKYLGSFLS